MKQQTPETTIQNSVQEKNSKKEIEVLSINFFYKKYENEKSLKASSRFSVKKKRTKKVPLRVFKKIIKEYFTVYFYDFYYSKNAIYFPFGGMAKKVLYSKWLKKLIKPNTKRQEYDYKTSDNAIGIFWYMRPSKKMEFMVKLKKLTGKTNALPEIEANFLKTESKDLIPIFTTERKKGRKHKTLYRNY